MGNSKLKDLMEKLKELMEKKLIDPMEKKLIGFMESKKLKGLKQSWQKITGLDEDEQFLNYKMYCREKRIDYEKIKASKYDNWYNQICLRVNKLDPSEKRDYKAYLKLQLRHFLSYKELLLSMVVGLLIGIVASIVTSIITSLTELVSNFQKTRELISNLQQLKGLTSNLQQVKGLISHLQTEKIISTLKKAEELASNLNSQQIEELISYLQKIEALINTLLRMGLLIFFLLLILFIVLFVLYRQCFLIAYFYEDLVTVLDRELSETKYNTQIGNCDPRQASGNSYT